MDTLLASEDEALSASAATAAQARAEHYRALDVAPHRASRAASAIPLFERGASTLYRRQRVPTRYLRAKQIEWNGLQRFRLEGYATTYDQPYDMYDLFGPYQEEVAPDALTDSLAADPDVVFLVNHTGLGMARTVNREEGLKPTLYLTSDSEGLGIEAFLNPKRSDVQNVVHAITDRDVNQMSFAFWLEEGWWNNDFSKFRITKAEIDGGDVSAVNFGANPFTSIASRTPDVLEQLDMIPLSAARAALARLSSRIARETQGSGEPAREVRSGEDQPPATGRSLTYFEGRLAESRIG